MPFLSTALALLLHLLPSGIAPLRAQSSRKDDIVFNARGILLAGATVRVCAKPASGQPGTPLASIFSDAALTQALANPTNTDGLGNYFFYAAPGKYMIEISGPGISTKQIPNVTLPNDPNSPVFATLSSTGAISAFSLTPTGNLTVNGSTSVLGNLASGTLNLTNQATPPGASSSGTVNLYTKTADKKLYYKDDTGTETGPLGVGGGGGSPGGNNGDLQAKSGSVLQGSGVNDNGTQLTVNRDAQFCGPMPYYDIRCYGATQSSLFTTGSITSGTPTLTLASAQDFASGQGVVVFKAGALPSLTTPGTPTVTPNITNGATTYSYQVIAEDTKGGLTAASAAGSTAGGAATLGVNSITGATGSITNGILTVTTSVAHGLATGSSITLTGGINGQVTIASVPSSTTFNVSMGQVGNASGITGITVTYRACNVLTFPAGTFSGTGTLRYWTYRSINGGAFSISNAQIGLDPYLIDCGGTAPTAPAYVPSTPPGAAQAGYLATTISSGGGTTTLTLAANAGTTATSQSVVHDDTPALLAAMNAAAAGPIGGAVRIPAINTGGITYWPFNSAADMRTVNSSNSNYLDIIVDGYVGLNQPWILRSNLNLLGQAKRNSSFMYTGGSVIAGNGYPLLYGKVVSAISIRRFFLDCSGAQCTDAFFDTDGSGNGSVGITFEDTDAGNNSNGGLGTARNIIIKGGFDYFFRGFTCDPSVGSVALPAPCLDFTDSSTAAESASQMAGRIVMDRSWFNNSGIRIWDGPNGNEGGAGGLYINHVLFESLLTTPYRVAVSKATADYIFTDVLIADSLVGSSTPVVDFTGSANVFNVNWTAGLLGNGSWPLLIGPSSINATIFDSPTANYGNTAYFASSYAGGNPAQTTQVSGHTLSFLNGGRAAYQMANPGAVTGLTLSAGGSIPIGAHSYAVTAVDADGNETLQSPPDSITVTSGNQVVTGILPALPTSAAGWGVYRDNFRILGNFGCSLPQLPATATTFSDVNVGGGAGNPNSNTAGSSILSSNGLSTYQLRLNGAALTGTTGANTLAATGRGSYVRGHLPTFDANSNLIDAGVSPTNVTDFFNRPSGNLGSETNSPWTVEAGTLLVSAGGVGGNASGQNYAVFTGVGFPNDDQSVSATWVKTGTPSVQSNNLILRGSPSALTNYLCGPQSTGTSISIGKFVAGSFTSLASQSATINNGDTISFNVTGSSLNCYVNGVPIVSATDSSITSGFPGLGAFQTYNANGANLQWRNWMASPGYVSLQRPQTWSQVQTFTPGVVVGSDQVSDGPRSLFGTFLPGALTSTWIGSTATLDKAITVTRVQVQAKTAPSGCTTNAIVRLTDGTTPVNVTVSGAANDSGGITQNYAAGASLTVSVQTAAAGCTTSPADANAVIQYKMHRRCDTPSAGLHKLAALAFGTLTPVPDSPAALGILPPWIARL